MDLLRRSESMDLLLRNRLWRMLDVAIDGVGDVEVKLASAEDAVGLC